MSRFLQCSKRLQTAPHSHSSSSATTRSRFTYTATAQFHPACFAEEHQQPFLLQL
eukprot:CAMPEP_0185852802 /NCGR_PEP_ID=MMETSP1354-20130828/16319_1 /TAXON_ID=708628 /ORGANISM="Erythrolobus madagascarensis, Strain CCMP3276" /LENGTH=54 /DNA_ID=CAMNT_0028554149 /DNA_START=227 /DNA_END=391 /DNA_ORIENTATION=+